jgi:hypothetical protein
VITRQPSRASSALSASPSPVDPPVTSATRPVVFVVMALSFKFK